MQGHVSDDDDKEELAPPRPRGGYDGARSSTDLLDLVRSAEEAATVATRSRDSRPRSDPDPEAGGAGRSDAEEFVDVGDEALEAPPSLPPDGAGEAKELAGERRSGVHARTGAVAPGPRARGAEMRRETAWPPALGVSLIFGVAVGVLALLAR